jgi:hypothetical protein
MTEPATIRNPPKQPLLSPRRIVITLILVGAVVLLVFTWQGTQSGEGGGSGCANPVVVGWDPCPGSRILRQAQIGVELKPGYDGRITVNGIAVPEAQMQGAIAPGTEAYEQLSPEERALGPRPNNKNIVKFQPGKGKVVEEFSGQVRVGIRYWQESEGEDTAQPLNYTVFVT